MKGLIVFICFFVWILLVFFLLRAKYVNWYYNKYHSNEKDNKDVDKPIDKEND